MTEAGWTWSDVEQDVAPRTDTVDLVLDGTIAAQLEQARSALATAKRENDTLDDSTSDERAEVERLEQLAEASTRTFTVRSIGWRRWRELIEQHPADDPAERWDAAAFIPAALLACCDQFRTEADVESAAAKLSTGQIAKLFGRIRVVNEGDDRVPFSRGR